MSGDRWTLIVPGKPRPSQAGQLVGTPALDIATRTGVIHARKARMFPKRSNTQWIENCRALALRDRRRDMPWSGGVVIYAVGYVRGSPVERARSPFPLGYDADRAANAILDGLKQLAFGDDRWVKTVTVDKEWGDVERTEILVTRWP